MNVLVKNTNDYLARQSEPVRMALEKLRQTIKEVAPKAEEVISYKMPAFKLHGRILVYFAASKEHCSLFVGNGTLIQEIKNELKEYETTKGSIHFTVKKTVTKSAR